jgi:tetratricopeptide (TPR) repeat protein
MRNFNTYFDAPKTVLLGLVFIMILFVSETTAQTETELRKFKADAIEHMQAGRYGEAIDLLNKYITTNAREAEGYNLRAICYENRSQYQNAVLDFRRAIALEPGNQEYRNNLSRVIEVWYAQLRKKIEGHKREIAIDPNNPFNYLEIGKSYRWMEEWSLAEQWYDEYLLRDPNASPDEIIRYTEILAKTGSILKGERILREYVGRYPDDWRLWSRFGYFLLWLAKYREAQQAFETALSFKPFFKEAQDGLDIAKNEAYVTQENPRAFEKVYPIDRFYSILRRNPDDDDTRFQLVEALIQEERIEEAYQQLQRLAVRHQGEEKFDELWMYVTNYRDETYRNKVEEFRAKLEENPQDVESVKKLAQYHEYLQEYDQALQVLDNYFALVPDEKDPELRFQYARINAWARYFDSAMQIMDNLLVDYPDNLDYQLFRAQLAIWNKEDIELAREYLDNVLAAEPENVDALIAMGSLRLIDNDFEGAQSYADQARELDPNNGEVIKLEQNIEFQKLRYEEEQLFKILNEGRELVIEGDYEGAIPYYQDYLAQAEPNNLILKEYGDVLFGAGRLQEAKDVYDQAASSGYYYEASLQRAKVAYALDDTTSAIKMFKELVKKEPYEFEPRLYLGDSYAKAKQYENARNQYDTLLTWNDLDSTEIEMIELRKGYLPVTGLAAIFETFPNYIGLAPQGSFYSDNLSFRFWRLGARMELGFTYWLTFGVSYYKTQMNANAASLDEDVLSNIIFTGDKTFTSFKGHLYFRFIDNVTIGTSFGQVNVDGFETRDESEAFINFEKKDTVALNFQYTNTDAALILYSPYLIDNRLFTTYYRIGGYLNHKTGFHFSGYFSYLTVTDGNEGNDLQLRIGRRFLPEVIAGYEYFYSNYKYDADLYYSPNNFESHSLFIDSWLEKKKNLEVKLGGKIGFVPSSDFLLLAGYLNVAYKVSERLNFEGRLNLGSTSRDNASYKYIQGQLSAYWTIY